jgi:RimJ/RimL family protein N-acetyltransferase
VRVTFLPIADARPIDAVWPRLSWPPEPGLALRGTAVTLTQLDPDHDAEVAELFAALDHDAVWRHVAGRPATAADYAIGLAKQQDDGRMPWLVRLVKPLAGLDAGTVVGTSSYLDICVDDARLEVGATAYTPAVWAGAVNPDTKLQLLTLAFDGLGAGRVQLKTDVRNTRSQQAIARLGARYEGTLRRHHRRSDGTIRDSVLFSILAEEWPAVRERLLVRVTG